MKNNLKTATIETMAPYSVDMKQAYVGVKPMAEDTKKRLQKDLQEIAQSGEGGFVKLPADTDALKKTMAAAADLRSRFKHLVVVGTGGSSLGGQALRPLSTNAKTEYSVEFLDNVDPHTTSRLLENLAFEKTGFAFVSKSGNTLETMSQMIVLLEALTKKVGEENIKKHCVTITEPPASPMRTLSEKFGIPIVTHAPVGGRFSVLSAVGMFPAAFLGLDCEAFHKGASAVLQQGLDDLESPLFSGADFQNQHHNAGRTAHVLMTYNDRLGAFGEWFRQLVAESLGKEGKGITPIPARGTVDQHSILQLFEEGENDKIFTFILADYDGKGALISEKLAKEAKFDLIAGKHMGDIMAAFQNGTVGTLVKTGKAVRIIHIDKTDEYTMGALFMHFMLETSLTAKLLGINAYNQPGVEGSKILAKEYLSR
ncbi:MAG: hypothetical protein U1E36_09660 [Rickettsiales bacterium]